MFKKKGFMFEFLVRLIIALVFLFGALFILKSMFRLSSTAEESFNELAELIDTIEEDNRMSIALVMDKGTAIAIFNKDKKGLYFQTGRFFSGRGVNDVWLPEGHTYYMKKPTDQCLDYSACICLCKKVEMTSEGVLCQKNTCKNIKPNTMPMYDQRNPESDASVDFTKDGLIIFRDVDIFRSGTIENPRAKTTYVTEHNGFVAVCQKSPCPPEGFLDKQTGVTGNEVKENYLYYKQDLIRSGFGDDKSDGTYYHIFRLGKDLMGTYYYEYHIGTGRGFRTEKENKYIYQQFQTEKERFEENIFSSLAMGKSITVQRPIDIPKEAIKKFKPNLELGDDGKLKPIRS